MMIWDYIKKLSGFGMQTHFRQELCKNLYHDRHRHFSILHTSAAFLEFIILIIIILYPNSPFFTITNRAYFLLYLIILILTIGIIFIQRKIRSANESFYFRYFIAENIYLTCVSFWGTALTFIDYLNGNGISVYIGMLLVVSITFFMEPWKIFLVFSANFILLNLLIFYFNASYIPDHIFLSSLFFTLIAFAIATMLYHANRNAKINELLLIKQYDQIKSLNKELHHEANIDILTHLNNRNSYKKVLKTLQETPSCHCLACIYIDVNGLHEINNHLGHDAGDLMLKTISEILSTYFRFHEIFRIGGDEFVVLCQDMEESLVVKRIHNMLKKVEENGYAVSTGYAWHQHPFDVSEMIRTAEQSMQEHKVNYYQNLGGERQKRILNEQLETLILEKQDADSFLNLLSPIYKGVYFINMETNQIRTLFIPSYFDELLKKTNNQSSEALELYAKYYVKSEYWSSFQEVTDYKNLKRLLAEHSVWEFVYQKTNGDHIKLQIFLLNYDSKDKKETLWIFQQLNSDTL